MYFRFRRVCYNCLSFSIIPWHCCISLDVSMVYRFLHYSQDLPNITTEMRIKTLKLFQGNVLQNGICKMSASLFKHHELNVLRYDNVNTWACFPGITRPLQQESTGLFGASWCPCDVTLLTQEPVYEYIHSHWTFEDTEIQWCRTFLYFT